MNDQTRGDGIDVRTIVVGRQPLRVATTRASSERPPLLLFNGIGANWKLAKPFIHALNKTAIIIFDVPGIGASPLSSLPYRPSTLARLAAHLVAQLGHRQVNVAGVSWGGGIAQQFAHQHGAICRKLILAATSPGAIMVPGRLSVIMKLATPRRYVDRDYMSSIAAEIYGGAFRDDPKLIASHAHAMSGATNLGYAYQLLAMVGWTSLPWLSTLRQPTLVLMGRNDPLVPPVNGRILARLIPNARLQMIDDGHLFMVTRPVETARTIEEFLND